MGLCVVVFSEKKQESDSFDVRHFSKKKGAHGKPTRVIPKKHKFTKSLFGCLLHSFVVDSVILPGFFLLVHREFPQDIPVALSGSGVPSSTRSLLESP